ncbi:MAG: efflux RND transporter periplasmic adaptor subunit [Mycobacteriales bacterium]
MKRNRTAIPIAGIALLALAGCSGGGSDVRVAPATTATVQEIVEAPAQVTAKASAVVSAPADGRIVELDVQPGEQVAAGQVLGRIDSPSARQRLAQAQQALAAAGPASPGKVPTGSLAGAKKQSDQAARQAFDAARQAARSVSDPALQAALLAQADAAEKAYQGASATAQQAIDAVNRGVGSVTQAFSALGAAQRSQAESAVQLAQTTVDSLTLKAPIAGTVQLGGSSAGSATSGLDLSSLAGGQLPDSLAGQLAGGDGGTGGSQRQPQGDIGVGTLVSSGTPVVTLVDVSELGLAADVDETDILLVQQGQAATVELDAVPGGSYPATVRSIDLQPTASSRGGVSYRVHLTLGGGQVDRHAAPVPRPGMSAVARLRVRTAADAVSVPSSALVRDGGRDAVWLVRDGRAQRHRVVVGVQGESRVAIASGLKRGDRVVVRGADKVSTGQKVS